MTAQIIALRPAGEQSESGGIRNEQRSSQRSVSDCSLLVPCDTDPYFQATPRIYEPYGYLDDVCTFDCGARCRCAEQYAVKWTVRALIFCGGIAAIVWLAPMLMKAMAQ